MIILYYALQAVKCKCPLQVGFCHDTADKINLPQAHLEIRQTCSQQRFHRHSHDLGVAGIGMPLPHAAAGAGVSLPGLSSGPASSRALDDPLVLDAVPAAGFSHSQALLRTAESRDGTPSLLAFDLGLALWVWAWAPSDSTRGWPRPGGSAGSARRPPGLLPEGRAPPRPLA